ncbi:MAG: glycosyltransferase [Verrucomicrobia bacterium]|nr:glycosyltransferase [Verrucomicrobiota bacterium]
MAFLGTRGIPANYSGFETFVEQLATRLVQRGHEVIVFNRYPFVPLRDKYYRGVRIIRLPTIQTKSLDTLVHSLLSCLILPFIRPDVVYFCGVGNAVFCGLVRLLRRPVILNVDGEDWAREKWTGFAKWWLKKSEAWASRFASVLIADSRVIEKRYSELYGRETVFIPYGANVDLAPAGTETLTRFGLTPQKYVLFVGRIVPENCADVLIRAFTTASLPELKLAIVGDAPYAEDYKRSLRALADERVVFTGYAFGQAYRELSRNCSFYVLASAVDGTRPVLLDQMGFGNCVLVRDSPANSEVVSDAGALFDSSDAERSLAEAIRRLARDHAAVTEYRKRAVARVRERYDWERVTDAYELLLINAAAKN